MAWRYCRKYPADQADAFVELGALRGLVRQRLQLVGVRHLERREHALTQRLDQSRIVVPRAQA